MDTFRVFKLVFDGLIQIESGSLESPMEPRNQNEDMIDCVYEETFKSYTHGEKMIEPASIILHTSECEK